MDPTPRVTCRPATRTLSAGTPHPARAFGAPPPPPPRGRGPCVAISGEQPYPGWSRWEAVSGSSPGSPHALDRGDIATGGGADGEGERVPPPLSLTLPNSAHLIDPPRRHFCGGCPYALCRQPPPHPRLRRSSPAPAAGAWAVRGDIRGAAVPGSFPGSPRVRDRGDIATGGGADGEGACPLPCLPRSNHLTPRHPHPARACGAPPPPRGRGRGQCLRYQVSSRAPDHGCYRHGGSRRGDSPAASVPLRDKNLRPFRTRSRPGGAAPGSGRRGAPRGRI